MLLNGLHALNAGDRAVAGEPKERFSALESRRHRLGRHEKETLMSLLQQFVAWRSAVEIRELSDKLAGDCWPAVCELVAPRLLTLSPAETRGYVRAHAGPAVRASVAAMLRTDAVLRDWAQEDLTHQTLVRLIHRSFKEAARLRRLPQPLRKAA